ncbi:hypothetical protein [Fluviicola taffensis]|uniref:hypothetical protein n=1 Tax=Fluviicola taffensis TaxID=191579 RepID=UPI00313785E2
MKTLFTVLTMSVFSFSLPAQKTSPNQTDADNCSLTKRQVLRQAVQLWKGTYEILRCDGFIDEESKYDNHSFKKTDLDSLRRYTGNYSASGEIIFRYYMEENVRIPRIAIGDGGDTNVYLTVNESGQGTFQTLKELSPKFGAWKSYLDTNKDLLVNIVEYRYCWKFLDIPQNGALEIIHVAYTVSPDNIRYDVPQNEYEGYIAFDLLFNCKDNPRLDNLLTPLQLIDFAVPCPKNCPPSK